MVLTLTLGTALWQLLMFVCLIAVLEKKRKSTAVSLQHETCPLDVNGFEKSRTHILWPL